jgi:hypothetical protein
MPKIAPESDLLPVVPPANSPLLGSQVEFRFRFQLWEESKGSELAESCGRQHSLGRVRPVALVGVDTVRSSSQDVPESLWGTEV